MFSGFYFFGGSLNHASCWVSVCFPSNKLILKTLHVLSQLGYIRSYNLRKGSIVLNIRYFNDDPVIKLIKCVSIWRVYWSCSKLKYMVNKTNSIFLLSTSKGLLTSDKAIFYGVGGEILLLIR